MYRVVDVYTPKVIEIILFPPFVDGEQKCPKTVNEKSKIDNQSGEFNYEIRISTVKKNSTRDWKGRNNRRMYSISYPI